MSTAQTPIRLLVVDDHNLFRRGLVALLGQDARLLVVGEAGDANQALNVAQRLRPDLILLDNHLPGVHGELVQWLERYLVNHGAGPSRNSRCSRCSSAIR